VGRLSSAMEERGRVREPIDHKPLTMFLTSTLVAFGAVLLLQKRCRALNEP
jgi:hypothetical protein